VVVYDALATPVLGQAMVNAIHRVTTQPIKLVIAGHYHADHIYGLQAFKKNGVQIWGHENGQLYLNSDAANERLAQRRADLAPWVDQDTKLPNADRWLSFKDNKIISFQLGDTRFKIIDSSGAHSDEDLLLAVENEGVLFSGDLFFSGRIPFVGNANSKVWLTALERMMEIAPIIVIPGHGPASTNVKKDMEMTRSYLLYLREKMGAAVQELQTFDEAYQATDWSQFERVPAFQAANRLNAYGTYLLMEKESLQKK
jgi:glyoxylase-like metal-dependent hydrolase (beta-lactamase superfamily II)